MDKRSYLVDTKRLDLARARIRFFRAPGERGVSRHYAVLLIPQIGDPSRVPHPLAIALNAGSNWSVVRARRLWHAVERQDERGLDAAIAWLTRDAALPAADYRRAALPWYLDPAKPAGSQLLLRLVAAFAPLRPFDPDYRTIEMPKAQGQPFAFTRPTPSGKRTDEIRPGAHRIRIVRPDTGRQMDLFGSEGHLKERVARIGGDGPVKLQFYCCPSVLRTFGLTAPAAAVERLGAKEAARRGLAPVAWDRHGDDSLTNMPRS
jgi:hypothetical protein